MSHISSEIHGTYVNPYEPSVCTYSFLVDSDLLGWLLNGEEVFDPILVDGKVQDKLTMTLNNFLQEVSGDGSGWVAAHPSKITRKAKDRSDKTSFGMPTKILSPKFKRRDMPSQIPDERRFEFWDPRSPMAKSSEYQVFIITTRFGTIRRLGRRRS